MNKYKRGQSEIITTVLIILLVLAAVVIVWQVVKSTVSSGTGQIPGQTDCMTVSVDILAPVYSNGYITIKRNVGTGALIGMRVFVDGKAMTGPGTSPLVNDISLAGLSELGTLTTTYKLPTDSATKKLQIAKLIGTDINNARLCDFTDDSVSGVGITQAVQCADGIDNEAGLDLDGLIDYPDDPQCLNAADNDETNL